MRMPTIALLTTVALGLGPGSIATSLAGPPPVAFSVTPASAQYQVGEQIVLTLTLTNTGTEAVTVCTFDAGTLRLVLTKDGTRVKPERTIIFFSEDPGSLQEESLVTLGVGESVEIPFDVDIDPRFGSSVRDVRLPKVGPNAKHRQNRALVRPIEGAGLFEARFIYKYRGPDGDLPGVLRRKLRSNSVQFTVTGAMAGAGDGGS